MEIRDLELKDDFVKKVLKDSISDFWSPYQEEQRATIKRAIKQAQSTDDFVNKILENRALIKTQLYSVILKGECPERIWKFNRTVMGTDCFKTSADAGGLKIGNEKFSVLIRTGGDGTVRVAVKSKEAQKDEYYTNDLFYYDTVVEGEINIYSYDCGNEISKTINGRYGVFTYDGMVLFEEWKTKERVI